MNQQNGKAKKSNGRVFFEYIKGAKRLLFFAIIAAAIGTALNFLTPQIIRLAVDSVLGTEELPGYLKPVIPSKEPVFTNMLILAAIIIAAALVRGIFVYFQRTATLKAGERTAKKLRNNMFRHIQSLPYSWHTSIQTGDIIQRSNFDIDTIKRFISEQVIEVIQIAVMLVIGLVIMFIMNYILALITLVFIPLVLLFSAIYFSKIAHNFLKADEADGESTACLQENLTGIRVVRAFGQEKMETEKFSQKAANVRDLWTNLGAKLGVFWATGDLFAGVQILTVLSVGTVLVVNQMLSAGMFIAFMAYSYIMIWPVRNMGRILGELSKANISLGRVREVLETEPEKDSPDSIDMEIKGEIEFKNVSFSFNDDDSKRKVLDNVSFKIEKGKTLGIIGGTGGGKSTIIHLINRLYDATEGEILIDGVNVNKLNRKSLRKQIGLILQEPFLFSRSIRDNIKLSAPDTTDERMRDCARISSVDDTIEEFDSGYDTIVGERGVTLSGGQKQRVAITRTLVANPPVIIFDDSLSAIDTETDQKIRAALKESLNSSTMILISHRLTTILHADLILVLDEGKIVDSGTHDQLKSRDGIYKTIYDMQVNAGFTGLAQ